MEDAFREGELTEVDGVYDIVPGRSADMDVLYDMLASFDEDSVKIYSGLIHPLGDEPGPVALDAGPDEVVEDAGEETADDDEGEPTQVIPPLDAATAAERDLGDEVPEPVEDVQ